MEPLQYLSNLSLLFLIGILLSFISSKLKVPNILLLLLTGLGLAQIRYQGSTIFAFSPNFLISISVLTLVMIVFDGSSRFKLRELDSLSKYALRLVIFFLFMNMFILSVATSFLFDIQNAILCLIFAAVMSGTDPGSVMSLFKSTSNKILDLLKIESVLNTPIIVLIPFILLDLMQFEVSVLSTFIQQINPFLQQVITGVGTGVVIGLLVFRGMKKFYSEKLSPLILITAALFTYILSETLGGNGVLGVSILGVFFGNFYVKEKEVLQEFSTMLSSSLEILVFLLIGFIVPINITLDFLLKSLLLFLIMILLRMISVFMIHLDGQATIKERIFMGLNCSKGIAVAVVAFILLNEDVKKTFFLNGQQIVQMIPLVDFPGTTDIITLMVLFMLYSIILASVTSVFSEFFIKKKVKSS